MTKQIFNLRKVATAFACLAVTTVMSGCEKEPDPNVPAFAEFSFANQRGAASIDAKKRTVKATAECGTNLASLAPEFRLSPEGATATVNGEPQVSGETAQNFAEPVVYTLTTPDGTTADWTVTITLPDDCPQVKKYITYNKPVTAYYMEYTEDGEDMFVAYENKERCSSFQDFYQYIGSEEIEYTWTGNNTWYKHTGDPVHEGSWLSKEYKKYEYPLGNFAAYVSYYKGTTTFYKYGLSLWDIVASDDIVAPDNTDVTQFYLRSEKVMDIMCDVYKDSQTGSGGTEIWTWWVDPATGFTLKYERIDRDGDTESYTVTKLVVGKPDWDGKHLRPKTSDTIVNVD
jgi:hypothetical protein